MSALAGRPVALESLGNADAVGVLRELRDASAGWAEEACGLPSDLTLLHGDFQSVQPATATSVCVARGTQCRIGWPQYARHALLNLALVGVFEYIVLVRAKAIRKACNTGTAIRME